MHRRFPLLAFAVVLASCSDNGMVGQVVQESPRADGATMATLTRQGNVYRLYLTGRTPPMAPWEVVRTEQQTVPHIVWTGADSVRLEPAGCGGTVYTPHSGKPYPHPDAEHGVRIGFTNAGCD
jgi:hypothetical protein